MAGSVDRPATTTSAPSPSARRKGPSPIIATHLSIRSMRARSSSPNAPTGRTAPARTFADSQVFDTSAGTVAILKRSDLSAATSRTYRAGSLQVAVPAGSACGPGEERDAQAPGSFQQEPEVPLHCQLGLLEYVRTQVERAEVGASGIAGYGVRRCFEAALKPRVREAQPESTGRQDPHLGHQGTPPLTSCGLTLRSASMNPPGLDVEDLGLRAATESVISAEQAERLAVTIDAPAPLNGDALPLLWHWVWFAPSTRTSDLGPDGHPRISPAAPTAQFPRRMWIGGRVRSEDPLASAIRPPDDPGSPPGGRPRARAAGC